MGHFFSGPQLKLGDVNGDGILDMGVTVYKKTPYHPVIANRPFIYTWNGSDIIPLWRGSRLAHPFTEYIFADLTGDGIDNLIAIEDLEDARQIIHAYHWKGFGFESMGYSEPMEHIEELQVLKTHEVRVRVSGEIKTFTWKANQIRMMD